MGKMKIFGNQKVLIDEKNRLTIPSKFRKNFEFLIFISFEFEGNLVVRSSEDFTEWSKLLNENSRFDLNARKLQRVILGNTFELKIDSKGRILIPSTLMEISKMEKNAFVVGTGDKMEIISEKNWIKDIDNNSELTIEKAAFELLK